MKITITLMIAVFVVAIAGYTATAVSATPSVTAVPLATPEKGLTKDQVDALLDQLQEGLADYIDDAELVADIGKKWDAHTDLTGKTRAQIFEILIVDVKSTIFDPQTRQDILASWKKTGTKGTGDQTPKLELTSASWLKLAQKGYYMAHFEVTWDEKGKAQKFVSEMADTSYVHTVNFPVGTANIRVHSSYNTGAGQKDIIDRLLTMDEMNKCLVTSGTISAAAVNFEDCETHDNQANDVKADPTRSDMWLTLTNNGFYIAHFDVTWDQTGKPGQKFHSDGSVGYKESLRFPAGTTNIHVFIANDVGFNGEPRREIINRALTTAELNRCLVMDGTTLTSKVSFQSCAAPSEE